MRNQPLESPVHDQIALCVRPALSLPLCSCIHTLPLSCRSLHCTFFAPDRCNTRTRRQNFPTERNIGHSTPRPANLQDPAPAGLLAPPTSVRRADVNTLRNTTRPRPRPSSLSSSLSHRTSEALRQHDQLTLQLSPVLPVFFPTVTRPRARVVGKRCPSFRCCTDDYALWLRMRRRIRGSWMRGKRW